MCGIAGWIDWENSLADQGALINKMSETLSNRGPDASGQFLSHHAAFGHKRLIVVDPAGGLQPMTRKAGSWSYTITYNGELYNTEDIRKELLQMGYTFKGHSDTEVLLTAYIAWGETCVERFNGIYAFGIWDDRRQHLFLARDRMGVKPLFYTRWGRSLLFASEIKALLAHPMVDAVVDETGLAEILGLGPGRTPGQGIFKGIKELRPGRYAVYSREDFREHCYWQLESRPHEDDLETTAETVRELFLDTISRQLVSDVPVCTLLSGGLDSSLISVLAAEIMAKKGMGPMETFSIDYVDNEKYFKASTFQPGSDQPWIDKVSAAIGSRHHGLKFDSEELVASLDAAMMARDLPGMADVDSSLYLFCREIKKSATVALSGECADEVFGGYPWFYREELLNTDTFPWSGNLSLRQQLVSPAFINKINIHDYVQDCYRKTLAEVPGLPGEEAVEKRRRDMFFLNINWFMATLLDRKDRMSMAAGLEVRVPFCDHRLVEYVWNIPWEMKRYGDREKGILRKAMTGILQQDVLWRKKSPYPKTHHPAYLDAVQKGLESVLSDSASPLLQIVDKTVLRDLLDGGKYPMTQPWYGQLMTMPQLYAYLMQLNAWLKHYRIKIAC